MPCYVDSSVYQFRRMKMCHLIADTLEELHAMAKAIGINPHWFQKNASFPHYDICKSKRAVAISLGAKEVDRHELVAVMKRFRKNHCQGRPPKCPPKSNS